MRLCVTVSGRSQPYTSSRKRDHVLPAEEHSWLLHSYLTQDLSLKAPARPEISVLEISACKLVAEPSKLIPPSYCIFDRNSDHPTMSFTNTNRVLRNPELFELVLHQLPMRALLTSAQLGSRHWRGRITSSRRLQQALYSRPCPPDTAPRVNPLLATEFAIFFDEQDQTRGTFSEIHFGGPMEEPFVLRRSGVPKKGTSTTLGIVTSPAKRVASIPPLTRPPPRPRSRQVEELPKNQVLSPFRLVAPHAASSAAHLGDWSLGTEGASRQYPSQIFCHIASQCRGCEARRSSSRERVRPRQSMANHGRHL